MQHGKFPKSSHPRDNVRVRYGRQEGGHDLHRVSHLRRNTSIRYKEKRLHKLFFKSTHHEGMLPRALSIHPSTTRYHLDSCIQSNLSRGGGAPPADTGDGGNAYELGPPLRPSSDVTMSLRIRSEGPNPLRQSAALTWARGKTSIRSSSSPEDAAMTPVHTRRHVTTWAAPTHTRARKGNHVEAL